MFLVFWLMVLVLALLYVLNTGSTTHERIQLQNAVDAGTMSGGVWVARSMNLSALSAVSMTQVMAHIALMAAIRPTILTCWPIAIGYQQAGSALMHSVFPPTVAAGVALYTIGAVAELSFNVLRPVATKVLVPLYRPPSTNGKPGKLWLLVRGLRKIQEALRTEEGELSGVGLIAETATCLMAIDNGADAALLVEFDPDGDPQLPSMPLTKEGSKEAMLRYAKGRGSLLDVSFQDAALGEHHPFGLPGPLSSAALLLGFGGGSAGRPSGGAPVPPVKMYYESLYWYLWIPSLPTLSSVIHPRIAWGLLEAWFGGGDTMITIPKRTTRYSEAYREWKAGKKITEVQWNKLTVYSWKSRHELLGALNSQPIRFADLGVMQGRLDSLTGAVTSALEGTGAGAAANAAGNAASGALPGTGVVVEQYDKAHNVDVWFESETKIERTRWSSPSSSAFPDFTNDEVGLPSDYFLRADSHADVRDCYNPATSRSPSWLPRVSHYDPSHGLYYRAGRTFKFESSRRVPEFDEEGDPAGFRWERNSVVYCPDTQHSGTDEPIWTPSSLDFRRRVKQDNPALQIDRVDNRPSSAANYTQPARRLYRVSQWQFLGCQYEEEASVSGMLNGSLDEGSYGDAIRRLEFLSLAASFGFAGAIKVAVKAAMEEALTRVVEDKVKDMAEEHLRPLADLFPEEEEPGGGDLFEPYAPLLLQEGITSMSYAGFGGRNAHGALAAPKTFENLSALGNWLFAYAGVTVYNEVAEADHGVPMDSCILTFTQAWRCRLSPLMEQHLPLDAEPGAEQSDVSQILDVASNVLPKDVADSLRSFLDDRAVRTAIRHFLSVALVKTATH